MGALSHQLGTAEITILAFLILCASWTDMYQVRKFGGVYTGL